MQRSATQVLFRYLPDAVFQHEEGFYAQVFRIGGDRVGDLNRKALLEQLGEELTQWDSSQVGIPDPRINPDEFATIEPKEVVWDVYPLTFQCVNSRCGRIRRWFRQEQVVKDTDAIGRITCTTCNSKMRQLHYLTAHNCGAMEPLHTPRCPSCGRNEDMYLDDLGSFRSSSWRCRTCGSAVGTRFTPCGCGLYSRGGAQPYRQGYTARDQRLWYPQTLTILNISGQTYDNLQKHPQRGIASLASWLGDEIGLSTSLGELDRPTSGSRMSAKDWADQEARLKAAGVDQAIINDLRASTGPATAGVSIIGDIASEDLVEMSSQAQMVERAGLFDINIVQDRKSIHDSGPNVAGQSPARATALQWMANLGIADISVTQQFPIVIASYGYSRSQRSPGSAHLRSYAKPRQYNGKTPIFAIPAKTEALLVTFSAKDILGFFSSLPDYGIPAPPDERAAKLALGEILAADLAVGGESIAARMRRLVHSASHSLLRALDDGQTGFGESSLAEWIVPNALTTAIYVGSFGDFTLGALDTVLRRRVAPWLVRAADDVNCCDNDPMCGHVSPDRPHAACDRCLHLSFGCRTWNADLDRKLLLRFWRWTRRAAGTP